MHILRLCYISLDYCWRCLADFTSTASVTININDINDNFPEFEEDVYEFSVDEHCDDGMVVGTITVSAYFIYSLFLFMVSMMDWSDTH